MAIRYHFPHTVGNARPKMAKSYPIRHETHQLEELSRRFFTDSMPRNWTCDRPASDYGVDLRIDLFDGTLATGLELLVQLKSSSKASRGKFETVLLNASTYHHLCDKLQVVMLVKYVEADNEAYWLMLRDLVAPTENQQTLSVRIPKVNRLSVIDWNAIQEDVRKVTDVKLAAGRKRQLQQSSR
ncbi:MAG: DUF4365 domain-containing protein [Tepidisphaeraceae bacterium]